MRRILKRTLQALLPAAQYAAAQAVYNRRLIQRYEQRSGLADLNQRYEARWGRTVRRGPFQGMAYTPLTTRRHVTQRLIGCYECELHDIVGEMIRRGYRRGVDVGCAEGYYAVGFARALPGCVIEAFDTDPWARRACRRLAEANGVADRVRVKGYCSTPWLRANAPKGGFVISDCEGFERALFNAETAFAYRGVDLLVELHDRTPQADDPMAMAMRDSHEVTIVLSAGRDPAVYEETSGWPERDRALAVSDMRTPGQGWFYFRART
jgi:hypothetical protein